MPTISQSSFQFLRLTAILGLGLAMKAQVSAPHLGYVQCPDHSVRAVYGLSASMLVSPAAWSNIDGVASSSQGLLLSSAGRLQLIRSNGSTAGEWESKEPRPVLGMEDDLSSAIAWLPSTQTIVHWQNSTAVGTSVDVPFVGPVLAIRRAGSAAQLLISEGDAVSEAVVSLATGNIVSSSLLPGVLAPALWAGNHLIYSKKGQLIIVAPDGSEESLALPVRDAVFSLMNPEWVHIASPDSKRDWALHLTRTGNVLSEMPSLRALSTAKPALSTGGSK